LVFFLAELSQRNGFAVHRSCNLFSQWPWDLEGKPSGESAFERVTRELTELWPDRVTKNVKQAQNEIAAYLPRLCLDARIELESAGVKSFAGLIQTLPLYQQRFENAVLPKLAMTEVTATIFEALDYCLMQRGMVLVEGTYRSGKSFSSQAWCQMHLGEARYVQLNSSTDVSAFYREIARAVGVASSLQMKAMEMRARVEDTLRGQQLLLCVDESEWLFPQSSDVRAVPERMSWIMTALGNQGVPVALIGSRNFTRLLHNAEKRCPVWGSEQLHGRIKLRKSLPDSLSESDLFKIACAVMPEASKPMQMLLVGHALKSKGRIAAIEAVASRARFFAARADRHVCFDDVERAMLEAGTMAAHQSSEPPARIAKGSAARSSVGRQRLASDTQTALFPNSRRSRLVSLEPS